MIDKNIESFYKNHSNEIIKTLTTEVKDYNIDFKPDTELFEKIVGIAKDCGFDFSVDDLIQYEESVNQNKIELTQDLLSNVSGGVGLKDVPISLLSLLMAGTTLMQSAPITHAVLSPESVLSSHSIMSNMDIPSESTASSGLSKEDVQSSSEHIENIKDVNIDWEYIQHLDLAIGAVAIESGVVENFRFNNGYIEKITEKSLKEGSTPQRIWNQDSGEGSANVMTCLFPSSSGDLSTESGSDNCFSKAVSPDARQMAQLVEIIYKIRKDKNYDAKNSNELKEFLNAWKGKKDSEKVGTSTQKNQRKTINKFINDLQVMVREQESDDVNDCSSGKDLPKYTAERMILAYFTRHFNDQNDVKDFYDELAKRITVTGESSINKETALSESQKLHQVYKKFFPESNTCYPSQDLDTVGEAKFINKLENGKVKIDNKAKFSDCVETSVRHTINFLTYSKQNKSFLLSGENNEENKKFLDYLKNAIKNETEIDRKNLKERIGLFYLYQTPEQANNGSLEMKSMWNYVLSNMNEEKESGKLYEVLYSKKNNELQSGLLNALKTYWNIAFSINDGSGICDEAKNVIDDIDKAINDQQLDGIDEKIKDAFQKTFSLFNPKQKVKVEIPRKLSCEKRMNVNRSTDMFGEIIVKVSDSSSELFNFSIAHSNGHANVSYSSYNKLLLTDSEQSSYLSNQDALLLYAVSNQIDPTGLKNLNRFNVVYSKISPQKMDFANRSYKTSVALKFYKNVSDLTCFKNNPFIFEEAKKIKVNNQDLSDLIFKKISEQSYFKDFIDEYLTNKYFHGYKSDSFLEEKAKDVIKNREHFFRCIKEGKITEEDIPYIDSGDWFKKFDGKFLMSILVNNSNISRDGLEKVIKSITADDDFFFRVVDSGCTGYEYILKHGNDQIKEVMLSNPIAKIRSAEQLSLEDVKNLAPQKIFCFSRLDLNEPDKEFKSIMAFLIDKLSDEDFEKFVQSLSEEDRNSLGSQTVLFYTPDQHIVYYNNAFEYAVRTNNISKALSILKAVNKVTCLGLCEFENEKFYTATGVLLKNKRIDILEDYKDKFDFTQWTYIDATNGLELNAEEFIDKILQDPTYKTRLGIH